MGREDGGAPGSSGCNNFYQVAIDPTFNLTFVMHTQLQSCIITKSRKAMSHGFSMGGYALKLPFSAT
jgi:hypothetical protein